MRENDLPRSTGSRRSPYLDPRVASSVGLFLLVSAALLLAGSPASAQCATAPNPIVYENARPGTRSWEIDGPISSDSGAEIQGYASATGVDTGDSIDLHVTVAGDASWDWIPSPATEALAAAHSWRMEGRGPRPERRLRDRLLRRR